MAADLELQLGGQRLTTAEVLFYMPDHPHLLQSFLWQTLDLAPRYPRLCRFLDYWLSEIEAVLHSVRVTHADHITPGKWRAIDLKAVRDYPLH
ncbi:MAG: protein usg [Asticcacaulis sp.]